MKTRLSLFLAACLVMASASPAAAKDEGKIRLLTEEAAAVVAGDTVWLAINWTAEEAEVSDFSMVLTKEPKDGVQVAYPENTATWTGLMNGHVLSVGEIDYTAVQVTVPSSFEEDDFDLEFLVTFTNAEGEQDEEKAKIMVPVVQYAAGEHIVQHGASAAVASGESAWVDVDMTGLAPVVDNVKMTVTGDLDVTHPAYGTSTSLHSDSRLEDGETDTARFNVSSGEAAPGTYELSTQVQYTFDDVEFIRTGTVEVEISS